ncbi:MAG TPA: hypothetical protein VJJ22_04960 [Candidatus Paceibacterota bacterium]
MDKEQHSKAILVGTLVLLTSTLAFGLGRLSKLEMNKPPLTITTTTTTYEQKIGQSKTASVKVGEGRYVASRNGTKYYLPTCGSAKRISETNRIWFNSIAEARSAGYSPAANCPGL